MNIKNNIINKFSYAFCIMSGIILSVAFTFSSVWWLSFVGLVPLMLVILGAELHPLRLIRLILTFSFGYYVPTLVWMYQISPLLPVSKGFAVVLLTIGIILIGLIQGLYLALSTIVFPKMRTGKYRDVLFFSALFVLAEFFQEYTPLIAFPWAKLGVIVSPFTPFIQSASLLGGLFISFLVIFINSTFAYIILNFKDVKKLVFASAVLLVVFISNLTFGLMRINSEKPRDGFDALVVQGNFSGLDKWSTSTENMFNTYVDLTRKGTTASTKLVVWPETAIPTDFYKDTQYQNRLITLARELDVTLVVGFFVGGDSENSYNSMLAVSPNGAISEPYHKQILAPFGEYFPMAELLKNLIPSLSDFIDGSSMLLNGETTEILDTPLAKIGGVICYESIFSRVSREGVNDGAQIIALGSNDSWFGETSALYQHFSHARMRAVETKRFVLRASNTGITSIISPYGEVKGIAQPFVPTYIGGNVYLESEKTLYSKIGDVIAIPCAGVFAYGLFCFFRRKPRNIRVMK